MKKWQPFGIEEISLLTKNPIPITDNSERLCPSCGLKSIRFYYHELPRLKTKVGALYCWCSECHKFTHWSGPPKSNSYDFDDPMSEEEYGQSGVTGLLDALNRLWDNNELPQTFVEKRKKKRSRPSS